MPSADQMAADFTSFGSRVLGNPNLDPETSSTYEGGIDYSQHGFNASLTYFYTDFEDKIVANYLTDGSKSWENWPRLPVFLRLPAALSFAAATTPERWWNRGNARGLFRRELR